MASALDFSGTPELTANSRGQYRITDAVLMNSHADFDLVEEALKTRAVELGLEINMEYDHVGRAHIFRWRPAR